MALVHPQSCPCVKSELDLFSIPPTQNSVTHGSWVEFHPMAALTSGPIEFYISGSGDDYIDLNNTYLQVSAKVVKKNGDNLDADDPVAPVNLWLHALFSQVDISLNEKLISASANTYAYRSYMETLLSYGSEAKHSQLTSSLWYGDTPGELERLAGNDNKGFAARKQRAAESKSIDMLGKLHLDIFCQERYLVNGVDIKLRLVRSTDGFCLMANPANGFAPKVVLNSATLFVRKIKLNPTVQLAHIKALERTPVKYPIRRIETKVFSVASGTMSVNQENLFLGQLPKRLVVGCVDNKAFNGDYSRNPFHFKHNQLAFLALYVDGQQTPAKPLQPNFENRIYARAFADLFISTGQFNQDEGNGLSFDDYGRGFTLYSFDLTPDLAESGSDFNLVKQGNVRLEMWFTAALTETINVVVYAEFENMIQIDRSRNVLFDYAA